MFKYGEDAAKTGHVVQKRIPSKIPKKVNNLLFINYICLIIKSADIKKNATIQIATSTMLSVIKSSYSMTVSHTLSIEEQDHENASILPSCDWRVHVVGSKLDHSAKSVNHESEKLYHDI